MQSLNHVDVIRTIKGRGEAPLRSLPINNPEGNVIGWLIPITEKLADNDEIVDSLASSMNSCPL